MALYSLTVQALTQHVVRISIPENKVHDISGNLNLASNILEVKHCKNNSPDISMLLVTLHLIRDM